jgi:demethylmenaquinone methyltransferase/2-methoxy-6-polyprenyl-1,4-benzoquinol methylase
MIRDYFNEKAVTWDSYSLETDKSKLERMVKRLGLKPGMTVLDIGTGTGIFLPHLLKTIGKKGQVIALDIAEKMLLQAKEKGFVGKIAFLCADVMDIPLQAETCDAVVCYSSFPHFQNKPKALREMRRVLKKGGCVFICHTSGREAINRIHHTVPLLHHDLLPDGAAMKKLLHTEDFTEISVEDEAESYFAVGRKAD